MSKKLLIGWILFVAAMASIYGIWLRDLVTQSFYGTAPDWFVQILNTVYPRFIVEKHRFELAFFLRHADQIVIRFGLISSFLFAFWLLKDKSVFFKTWQQQFWNLRESITKIRIYTWAVYSCVLFFSYDWLFVLSSLYKAKSFYRPLLLLQVLQIPFPPTWLIGILCSILVVSCILMVFRFHQVLFSTLVAMVFTLLQGWLYSFEKLDHAFAPLTYVLWLMPFVLHQSKQKQSLWALSLIRIIMGCVYLQAGLEKLLLGGMEWLAPETFRNYLYLHPTSVGLWVAHYDLLCILFPIIALLFQLSFITIVFFPKAKRVLLPLGILFHTGTFVLMDVGGVINAWVWLYILYL